MSITQTRVRSRKETFVELVDECLVLCRQTISELQSLSVEMEHSSDVAFFTVFAMGLSVEDLENIKDRTSHLIRIVSNDQGGVSDIEPDVKVEGKKVKPGTILFGIEDNVAWQVTKIDSSNIKHPIQAVKLKDNNIVRDLKVEWLSWKPVFLSKDEYAVDVGSIVYVGNNKAKAICKGFDCGDQPSGLYQIVCVKYQDGIFEHVSASNVFFRSDDSLNMIACDIIRYATNPERYVKDKHLSVTVHSNAHKLMMYDVITRLTELEEE